MSKAVPLIVDLDGTLLKTDWLLEAFLHLFFTKPFKAILVLGKIFRGRSFFKQAVAEQSLLNCKILPYRETLLQALRDEKEKQRLLVLVTASPQNAANQIASHIEIFNEAKGSTETHNLKSTNKAKYLVNMYGEKGFDYVGNSTDDLEVWEHASKAWVCGSPSFIKSIKSKFEVERQFENSNPIGLIYKQLRPHQWAKNLLVFIPLLLAHQYFNVTLLFYSFVAFMAMNALASSGYCLNDLYDLENDRLHSEKQYRPMASGNLSLSLGFVLAMLLLVFGIILFSLFSIQALPWALAYWLGSFLYSHYFKKKEFLDLIVLAGLYSSRLLIGSAATGVVLSFWLLSFSMFVFLSLAALKRVAEVLEMREIEKIKGRGYWQSDLQLISQWGVSCAALSVLVLALYLHSPEVAAYYYNPFLLGMLCPLLLFWLGRFWFKVHRGVLKGDPVAFAIKDRGSLIILALMIGVVALARWKV